MAYLLPLAAAVAKDPQEIVYHTHRLAKPHTKEIPTAKQIAKALELAKPVTMGKKGYYLMRRVPGKTLGVNDAYTTRYKDIVLEKVDMSKPPSWTELATNIRVDYNLFDSTELKVFHNREWVNIKDLTGTTGTEKVFNIIATTDES
eukprot:GHVU01002549.1.p1 GENE.GHVU01002549.1~~GHVU01002549.1.p1  ORF type:complete len:146 (+),score=19.96 GHVU01002549.1:148-585(+)